MKNTTNLYQFKYVETAWIDGNNISETEKNWSADNLNDYNRFREIWQELEVFDSNCKLTEFGTLLDDGNVSMVLDYTLETDQGETFKLIRAISYEIAE